MTKIKNSHPEFISGSLRRCWFAIQDDEKQNKRRISEHLQAKGTAPLGQMLNIIITYFLSFLSGRVIKIPKQVRNDEKPNRHAELVSASLLIRF